MEVQSALKRNPWSTINFNKATLHSVDEEVALVFGNTARTKMYSPKRSPKSKKDLRLGKK